MEILAEAVKMAFGPKEILKGIDFSLHNKEFVGIIGPNGSGKSTLLRAISGIWPFVDGKIFLPIREINLHITYLNSISCCKTFHMKAFRLLRNLDRNMKRISVSV